MSFSNADQQKGAQAFPKAHIYMCASNPTIISLVKTEFNQKIYSFIVTI